MGSVSVGGSAKFYVSVHCLKTAFILFDFRKPPFSYFKASILCLIGLYSATEVCCKEQNQYQKHKNAQCRNYPSLYFMLVLYSAVRIPTPFQAFLLLIISMGMGL